MAKREERKFQREESDIDKRVISIRRVTKVVKGGRTLSFSVTMVVGNKKGKVGIGSGKAGDTTAAIEKAFQNGKKNMVDVSLVGTTIPHEIIGQFGKSSVLLMPAQEGTGVIAGGAVRSVVDLAGIKDVVSKTHGARNQINVVKATLNGLQNLRTKEQVAALRGKSVDEI
ncbi:MAG: 30S ribosomal protein S5 [Clostridiales bacterium]|nr:30S ribosomal protein S5 [Candidatus Apopatousia equi]